MAKHNGQQLEASSAFTVLSLISLLAIPMNEVLRAIPMFNSALACFNRIQLFLNSDVRRDHRLPLNGASNLEDQSSLSASLSGYELQDIPPKPRENSSLIVTQDASFGWDQGGRPDVSDVTFTLSRQEFCFIIGPVGKPPQNFRETSE